MDKIREELQLSINETYSDDEYTLKTNEEIIDIIIDSGFGETEFHTVDIERLIKENEYLVRFFNFIEKCQNIEDVKNVITMFK